MNNSHLFKENWTVLNEVDDIMLHRHPCPWSVLSTYCVCHHRTGSRALPANLFEDFIILALKYIYSIMLLLSLIFIQGSCFLIVYRRMLLVFRCYNINYKILNLSEWYTFSTWCDVIWYDMIYLLTAVGLTPCGSTTVHIYTQTIHRTTQLTTLVGRLSGIRTQSGQTKINDELTA